MGRLLLVILGLSVLFVAGAATTLLYLRIAQHPAAAPQNLAEGAKPKPSAVLAPPPAPPVSLLVQAQPAAAGTATRAPLSAAQPRAVSAQRPQAMSAPQPAGNELQIPSAAQSRHHPGSNTVLLPRVADAALSTDTTNYLHHHLLPFVEAQVFRDSSGKPFSILLTGKVATEHGWEDAGRKARDFLGDANLRLDNQIQVKSQLASGEVTPKGQPGDLTLPQVFQGCWELVSDHEIGHVQQMPTARMGCVYTPNTGRFCYERTPDGTLEPTLSSFRIVAGSAPRLKNQWSRLEVISTDGQSQARMRFYLHHTDVGGFGLFARGTESIDERHVFDCNVEGGLMSCIDHEYGMMNGQPWCTATHGDEFRRVTP